MKGLIEGAARMVGRGLLAVVTFGSYQARDGSRPDRLVEGSIGLAAIVGLLWVGYRLAAG